ncbi:MAG: glycosyltransferase [Candidatus Sungiibacteriota bacterium]
MRICFLNHDLKEHTGAGRFGLQLIGRMAKESSDFHPIVLTTEESGHPWEKPVLSSNIFRLIFSFLRIRATFKECDIIHALDGFPYGVIAAVASAGLGKRLVITAVGTGAIQAFRHPIKGMLLRWAYRRADRVVAVSNYTKREILSRVAGLDISVINHGVDTQEFQESSDAELNEEEREAIRRMKPYILSVGGGKRRKGYEYSFPAFVEIKKRFPGLQYAIVGHDLEHTPAVFLGIEDKVSCFVWIGRPFLKALYRNAELFMLLPYDDQGDVEGFGFVFLEAAAAGLPVVGTYNSGAEDAINNGKNGFLVEPKNHGAAAKAAIKILSDRLLKEKFIRESLAFAKKMSWEKAAYSYVAKYKEINNGKA